MNVQCLTLFCDLNSWILWLIKNKIIIVFLIGPIYHENCDCPQEESSAWLEEMNCPQTIPQIQRDLANFPVVDPDKIAKEIPQRFGQRQSLCHYTIKDNEVWNGLIWSPYGSLVASRVNWAVCLFLVVKASCSLFFRNKTLLASLSLTTSQFVYELSNICPAL